MNQSALLGAVARIRTGSSPAASDSSCRGQWWVEGGQAPPRSGESSDSNRGGLQGCPAGGVRREGPAVGLSCANGRLIQFHVADGRGEPMVDGQRSWAPQLRFLRMLTT